MNGNCNDARCPACGSDAIVPVGGEVFCCEYCGTRCAVDWEHFDPAGKDKAAAAALKELFLRALAAAEEKRGRAKAGLEFFLAKASARAAKAAFFIALCAAAACLLGALAYSLAVLALTALAPASAAALSAQCGKAAYAKYHPVAMYYAGRVAALEEDICAYTKCLSRLSA